MSILPKGRTAESGVFGGCLKKKEVEMKTNWKWLLIGTIISWTLGILGVDRFYRGEIVLGIFKLITLGLLGIWWFIDACYWTYELGRADFGE
jgi:TM2 domain-containing membrane protein YozV